MAAPVIDLVVLLVFVLLSLSKTVNGLDNQIEIDQNVKQVLNDEMEILYNKQKDEQDVDKPAAIKVIIIIMIMIKIIVPQSTL